MADLTIRAQITRPPARLAASNGNPSSARQDLQRRIDQLLEERYGDVIARAHHKQGRLPAPAT